MGSPGGGCNGRRRAENVEMGTDSAHYKGDHKHDGGAGRNHLDWTDEPYYNKQPTRGEGRGEGVYERGGHAESDHDKETYEWDDDRVHGTGVLTRTGGGEYPGQYDDNVEECCDTEGED